VCLLYSSRLTILAIGYIHRRCDDGNDDGSGRLVMGDDDAYCDSTGDGRILRQGRNLRHDPGMDRRGIPMLPFHIFRRNNPTHTPTNEHTAHWEIRNKTSSDTRASRRTSILKYI
jgi:hypothetical protein